jgi:hypothetical protein
MFARFLLPKLFFFFENRSSHLDDELLSTVVLCSGVFLQSHEREVASLRVFILGFAIREASESPVVAPTCAARVRVEAESQHPGCRRRLLLWENLTVALELIHNDLPDERGRGRKGA